MPSDRPALKARKRSGDAAYHITEECERLFCETLTSVFLVERDTGCENSLVMDLRKQASGNGVKSSIHHSPTMVRHRLPTPSTSPDYQSYAKSENLIKDYLEIWDYTCGMRFRGFVVEKSGERCCFIFFDRNVIGEDLKPGLMALLELAVMEDLECDQLTICIDREAQHKDVQDITRDLGWVGFNLATLDSWSGEHDCISDRWLLLDIEL